MNMAVTGSQEFKVKVSADDQASGSLKNMNNAAKEAAKGFESLGGKMVVFEASLELVKKGTELVKKAFEMMVEPAKAAMEAETANVRLVTSLKTAGQYSTEAMEGIDKFTESLRMQAGVSDEVIKKIIATNVAIGMTIPQAEEAAQAAAALAKFQGSDLISANEELIGSLSGMDRGLRKVAPGVASLTLDQKRHGDAIKLVGKSLQEFVSSDAQTTQGALTRLQLGWDELTKKVGFALLQGADMPGHFATLSKSIDDLGVFVDKNRKAFADFANVMATMVVDAIKDFADIMKDVGPILEPLAKQIGNLIKLALLPFVEVFISINSAIAHFSGNTALEDKLDRLLEKTKAAFSAAKSFGVAVKEFPGMAATKEIPTTTKVSGQALGNTGRVNLAMTDQQQQQQLQMQRSLDDQRLQIELSFGNEIVAAHVLALNKIKQTEQDAARAGVDVYKQSLRLKAALDKQFQRDKLTGYFDDRAAAAQAAGDQFKIADTLYQKQINEFNLKLATGRMTLDEFTDAVKNAEFQRVQMTRDAQIAIDNITGDGFDKAQQEYDKQIENLKKLREEKRITAEQSDTATAVAGVNQMTSSLSVDAVAPMLGAIDKLVDAIDALVNFIPNLLNKVASLFNDLRDFPLKLAGAFKNMFTSAISMLKNIIPNFFKGFSSIIGSLTDFLAQLPEALIGAFNQLPKLIMNFINSLPNILQRLVPILIMGFAKLTVELPIAVFKAILNPNMWATAGKFLLVGMPNAIAKGLASIGGMLAKMLKDVLHGNLKFPKLSIDTSSVTRVMDSIKGSSSDIFKVEDFKAAAKNVDIGDKIRDAANSAALNIGRLLMQLWRDLEALLGRVWKWVWDTIIAPIETLLIKAWKWVWDNVLSPILGLVSKAFQWVIDNVLAPIGTFVSRAFQWVIDNVLIPLFSGIPKAFQWIVDNVIKPLASIGQAAFQWVYDHIVVPLNSIGRSAFQWVFDNIVTPLSSIGSSAFQWVYDNVVKPLMAVASVFSNFKLPEFHWPSMEDLFHWPPIPEPSWLKKLSGGGLVPGGGVVNNIGKSISSAVSSAGSAIAKIGGWEHGGMVRNGVLYAAEGTLAQGTDIVPAMLTPGEFVINRHAVSRVGLPTLDRINSGLPPGGGGLNITAPITINTTQPIDAAFIRSKLVPTLMEEIKRASQNGRYVLSTKGIRSV